jgi:hypothetical protein
VSGSSVFQAKARTAESYLAGIGASGALITSAFVLFIVLVGAVTFNAWPHPGQLISGSGGNVSLQNVPLTSNAPRQPAPTPNLVALLGGPGPANATPVTNHGGGSGGNGGGPSSVPGTGGGVVAPPVSGGGGGGNGQPTTNPPSSPGNSSVTPSEPSATERTGLGQVVAGVGNNVESDTNVLGQTLGGPDTTLGGLVQGLGSTLNNTLQQLGGTR